MLTKRQKIVVGKFVAVIGFTVFAVFAMFNVKDVINRREGMLAMGQLGQYILEYRKNNHTLPSPETVVNVEKNIEGSVRLGRVEYRSMYISIDSPADTILAYAQKKYYSLFLGSGYIVLRLDGKVEWMETKEFEGLLASQQGSQEIKAGKS